MTVTELVFLKHAPAGNLACHSQYSYYVGDDSYKQCCLFSDPVICLFIIVFFISTCFVILFKLRIGKFTFSKLKSSRLS